MNCDLGRHIRPEGWHHWEKQREQTARYLEYNNRGEGSSTKGRAAWSRQLTKKEAELITPASVFNFKSEWTDYCK
jgi:pectinesterase